MLKLELKRILKTRSTRWLMGIALVLSVAFGVMTVNFEFFSTYGDDGEVTEVKGRDAIAAQRERFSVNEGEVTSDVIANAYSQYQYATNASYEGTISTDEYLKTVIISYTIILPTLETFGDYNLDVNGGQETIMEITPDDAAKFYELRKDYIGYVMADRYPKRPEVLEKALELDSRVDEPFYYEYGIGDSQALSYMTIGIFLITIICSIFSAATFSSDYGTGADDIQRCAKRGRTSLGVTKLAAAFIVSFALFALCMVLFLVITVSAFGLDRTSLQMASGVGSLAFADLTINGMLIATLLSGLFSFLAVTGFTLFLSSLLNNQMVTLAAAVGIILLPTIIYFAGIGGNVENLIRLCLPSGGIGLFTNLLTEINASRFVWVGSLTAWSPYVMMIAPLVWIPILFALTVHSYNKHEVS